MRRTFAASAVVALLACLLAVIRPLEAQTPSSGGAFVPNTVIRIAGIWLNNKLLWSSTAPTQITAGFGTSPSISSNNGNATFRVTVGSGGTDSTGTITMPTASTGWNCQIADMSAPAGKAAFTKVTSSSATSISVTAYRDDGTAFAWNAGTTLVFSCHAY
jgi:hypothetical protein